MNDEDATLWKSVTETVTPKGQRRPSTRPCEYELAFRSSALDLHGLSLQQAFQAVREAIAEALSYGDREFVIITGLSGEIRREFPYWLETIGGVRSADTLNGGGAFRVRLKVR